jgi:hypothetical protein
VLGRDKLPAPNDGEADMLDKTKDEDKKLLKIKLLNDYLILSMDTSSVYGNVAFNLVRAAMSKEFVDGNAALTYKKLKNKYAPDMVPTLTELHKQFSSSKMMKDSDPDVFLTGLKET